MILSQAYGNLFAMTGSERYYPFSFMRFILMTLERCEYLNTTCEVLVVISVLIMIKVERLFVAITFMLALNDP